MNSRIWDVGSKTEVKKVEFPAVPNISLSADGELIAAAHGQKVTFLKSQTYVFQPSSDG